MSQHRRLLLLSFSLLMALFLVVSPIGAVTPNPPDDHKTWEGIQAPGLPFPDFSVEIEYRGKVMIVKISGMRMDTVTGYQFDGIKVVSERIDDLTIIFTPRGIPYPVEPPLQLMYKYPHHGKITWYDAEGNIIGTGTFGSRGGNMGSLVVNGPGLHVEGEYGFQVDPSGLLVGHIGWFIVTAD